MTRPAWAALLCLQLGCVKTRLDVVTPGSSPEAMLRVAGRDYRVAECHSGDREYFLGVDLADPDARAVVRVLVDPLDGPRLKVITSDGAHRRAVVLGPSSCRRLDASVEPTGWRVNHVRDFSGFLDADCKSDEGLEVLARVRFTHCH